MNIKDNPAFISAFILSVFAIIGTTLVALTFDLTIDKIKDNEKQAVLKEIYKLIPADKMDNDILGDFIDIDADELNNSSIRVYRARLNNNPMAVILSPVIAAGYNGPIRLIIAIHANATLGGVRVLSHRETPGLGDKVEEARSDWILGFENKSLSNPPEKNWKVKKDGGEFDQFTGATITPRGIVKAVKATLDYYQNNQEKLFSPATMTDINNESIQHE